MCCCQDNNDKQAAQRITIFKYVFLTENIFQRYDTNKNCNLFIFSFCEFFFLSATFAGFLQERVVINGKPETPDSGLRQYIRVCEPQTINKDRYSQTCFSDHLY